MCLARGKPLDPFRLARQALSLLQVQGGFYGNCITIFGKSLSCISQNRLWSVGQKYSPNRLEIPGIFEFSKNKIPKLKKYNKNNSLLIYYWKRIFPVYWKYSISTFLYVVELFFLLLGNKISSIVEQNVALTRHKKQRRSRLCTPKFKQPQKCPK